MVSCFLTLPLGSEGGSRSLIVVLWDTFFGFIQYQIYHILKPCYQKWVSTHYYSDGCDTLLYSQYTSRSCHVCPVSNGIWRIWYLSPMRAAKVQASLRIRAVSPEPSLLAHTSSESRGTFRQKSRSLAPLNGWACAVKTCHDGMLEDTNSLDGAQI